MEFEVDVSGEDLFNKDYTIVVAERNGNYSKEPIIYGFKFDENTIQILKSRHGQSKYKYGYSHTQKALFKIRVYSIAIFYIIKYIQIKGINFNKGIYLTMCRDFEGRENDIRSNLKYLLTDILKLEIKKLEFCRLPNGSNADKYAFLMRKDKKNVMKSNYIKISIEEFEEFLRK